MICKKNFCEYNSLCVFEDRTECIREKHVSVPINKINTFASEPFNDYDWRFVYYNGLFYCTGTGEHYFLKKKGKSFEIPLEFLKKIDESYNIRSIKDKNIYDSNIKRVLEKYITDLIKKNII